LPLHPRLDIRIEQALQLDIDRLLDDRGRNLQQLDRHGHQLLGRGSAVPLLGPDLRGMAHAGLGADQRIARDAEMLRDRIG
jgi:hypothetical protein